MSIGPWPQSNPPQVELTGRNAPVPTMFTTDIGSYNPVTNIVTAGSQVIAAGATWYGAVHNLDGYGTVSLQVRSTTASVSTSWKATCNSGVGGEHGLVTGTSVSVAGKNYSYGGASVIDHSSCSLIIFNLDASNALTVDYGSLYAR